MYCHIVDGHAFLDLIDFHHPAQGVHASIQIVLGGVEIAGKVSGNFLRNLALAELAEAFRSYRQRRGERVQRLIDILQQFAFFRLEAFGARPLVDLPGAYGAHDPMNFAGQLRLSEQGDGLMPVFTVRPAFVDSVPFSLRV